MPPEPHPGTAAVPAPGPRKRGWSSLAPGRRRGLVAAGLFLLALLAAWHVVARSAPARVNVAYWDEFDTALRLVIKLKEGQTARDFLADVVAVGNEHRLVTSRLLFAALYGLTGRIDFNVIALLGLGSLFGVVALLAATAGSLIRAARLTVLLAALLFHLGHYENLLWSGSSIDHYTVVLFITATVVGLTRETTAGLVAAGILGTVASYTLAQGLVVWPLGVVVLALAPGRRGLVAWLALAVIVAGTYFTGFRLNHGQSFVTFNAEGVTQVLRYWLAILGAVPALDSAVWAPRLGVALLALLGYAAARGGLRRERIALFLALGMAGAAGIIAIGRAAESGGQVFSRYHVLSGLAWALALFAALERHTHPRRPWQLIGPLLPSLVAFNAVSNREYRDETDSWLECRSLAVVSYLKHGRDGQGEFPLHPIPATSTQLLARAEQLGVYRLGDVCLPEKMPRGAREVGTMQFYVDELAVNGTALTARGWAALPARKAVRRSIRLILRSDQATHVFSARSATRPDVVQALKQPGWLESGFLFARRLDGIPAGTYRIGVLIEDGLEPVFTLTAHRVVIDGARSRVLLAAPASPASPPTPAPTR